MHSHWNYRVIKTTYNINGDPQYTYAVHEVYYDENKFPDLWTKEPVAFSGDSVEDLNLFVEYLQKALKAPVLEVTGNRLVEVKKE